MKLFEVGAAAGLNRRGIIALLGGALAALGGEKARAAADQDADVLNEAMVLRDPGVPVTGNPGGDITIVEWFDYQCPYCRRLEPELRQVVADDGKVRLVLKDWPILSPVSVIAARKALAGAYQGKYDKAHDAMMGVNSRLTEARIDELLASAGLDMDRLKGDLSARTKEIDAILARNKEQAEAFGFRGTPSFIVGHFRVPGVLSMTDFEQAIADARKANATK
jgi:protein-disulfide isomerase